MGLEVSFSARCAFHSNTHPASFRSGGVKNDEGRAAAVPTHQNHRPSLLVRSLFMQRFKLSRRIKKIHVIHVHQESSCNLNNWVMFGFLFLLVGCEFNS